ncbi:MAG: sulfatase-like hydrolase/transferase, partial [Planctomycetota bacterium]
WDERKSFGNTRNPVIEEAKCKFEAEHGSINKRKNKTLWKEIRTSDELRKRAAGQTPAGYGPTDMTDAEHCDGKNVRQCIEWLEKKAYGDKPFFMVCGIQRPHVPFFAPQKYFDRYPLDQINLVNDPASDWDDIPELALWGRYRVFMQNPRCPDDRERRKAHQAYYACITHIDTMVGQLLDAVKKQGLWNNTIIIFTSDHGYHLGEHGMWGKVTHFEPCDRIPFLVHVPGITKGGSACPRLIEFVDLYPTLVDLCNLKAPHKFEGTSFVPLLSECNRPWKKAAFTVVQRGPEQEITCKAVRSERWRYSEWNDPNQNELYDLKNDPNEWYNLAKDPQYADTVERMRELLNGGWKEAVPVSSN